MYMLNVKNLSTLYSPKTIHDLVVNNKEIKGYLNDVVNGHASSNLLLNGTNGTGKSTIARLIPILIEGYDPWSERLQGSASFCEKDAIAKLQTVEGIAKIVGQKYYYIIFDEIDKVKDNLANFWQLLDSWPSDVMVIATSNDYMNIDKCLRSRFKTITFDPVKAIDFLPRAMFIFQNENVMLQEVFILSELQKVENLADIRKYMEAVKDIYRNHLNGRIGAENYVDGVKPPTSPHSTLVLT